MTFEAVSSAERSVVQGVPIAKTELLNSSGTLDFPVSLSINELHHIVDMCSFCIYVTVMILLFFFKDPITI